MICSYFNVQCKPMVAVTGYRDLFLIYLLEFQTYALIITCHQRMHLFSRNILLFMGLLGLVQSKIHSLTVSVSRILFCFFLPCSYRNGSIPKLGSLQQFMKDVNEHFSY